MSDCIGLVNNAAALDTAPALSPFTGVRLVLDDETEVFVGNKDGRVLEAEFPWSTQAWDIANNVLASITGFAYQPFSAQNTLLDPAAELGDGVSVGGMYSVIASIDTKFDALCVSSISAPSDEEIDHEYAYSTPEKRLERRVSKMTSELRVMSDEISGLVMDVEGNYAEFQQTAEGITTKVEALEDDVTKAQSQITQTAEEIRAEVQAGDAALESKIEQQADSITLQVMENVEGEYYAKQSSVAITADGIDISSSGSINLASGASFTVDSTNFKVSENGYLTASGASLPSASATNMTIYDELSFKESSGGTETIEIDCSSRYSGRISMGSGNLCFYGQESGVVIYSNGGNFQVHTTTDGKSRIYLNGEYIESFDAFTGTAVFG